MLPCLAMRNLFTPLFLALALVLCSGSSCSPKRVVHSTSIATIQAVDQLMAMYNEKVAAGDVSVDQERQVKEAWEKYQKANLATEATLRMWLAADGTDEEGLKNRMEAAVEALKAMEDELRDLLKGLL